MLSRQISLSSILILLIIQQFRRKNHKEFNLKLIDFGLSLKGSKPIKEVSGTAGYVAPEILNFGQITEKSDIFSCGIVLFYMLCGRLPFIGTNTHEILIENQKNIINYEELIKWGVSEKAVDFVKKLLKNDPIKRFNISEALLFLSNLRIFVI